MSMRTKVVPAAVFALSAMLALAGCSGQSEPGGGTEDEDARITTEGATTTVMNTDPAASDVVLRYTVTGMHCGGCAQTIATNVAKLDGVTSCEASYEQSSAVVHVSDPALAEQVAATIADLGYEVQPVDDRQPS